MRLTTLAIQKLKPPPTGQRTYFDDTLGGFGIRVSQRSRSFVVMYGKRRRLKTLGRYPTLSLKEARREAQAFLTVPRKLDTPNLGYREATERFLEESSLPIRLTQTRPISRAFSSY
jgi:hypothetical protein